MIYVNEIDPYCAQWLQNLMDAGVLPPGHIDTRSIEDVTPNDLAGYTQCHFFAGLGGWIYALDLAGWPRDRPVWTGSCPCQPFSAAGKGAGFEDERHLWPAWQHLIAQRKPTTVFGEQVASKAVDAWIDLVHADMEGLGYAFGCIAFPSAGVGAPHIRDRTYWVADAERSRVRGESASVDSPQTGAGHREYLHDSGRRGDAGWMAHAQQHNRGRQAAPADHIRKEADRSTDRIGGHSSASVQQPGPTNGFWRAADWLGCTDGKWRPTQSTDECMADGVAESLGYVRTGDAWSLNPLIKGAKNRVGRLRAYGNAICAPAAEAFIRSVMESIDAN